MTRKKKSKLGGAREGAGRKPSTGPIASATLNLRLLPSQLEQWRALATARGVSVSEMIRGLVERELG